MITTIVQLHNELEFLPFWFSSAVKHSDEIICGINNCTDGSDAWIENYSKNSSIPIKIIYFEKNTILNNGFSYVKNELIKASSGKWIVSLDADEEMDITKEEIKKTKFIASTVTKTLKYQLNLYDINDKELLKTIGDWGKETHFRIFRNLPQIRWHGIIHEELRFKEKTPNEIIINNFNNIMWHYTNLRLKEKTQYKQVLYAKLLCRIKDNPKLRYGTNEYWYNDYFDANETNLRYLSTLSLEHFF